MDSSLQNRQGASNDSDMEWTSVQGKRGRRGAEVSTSPNISANSNNNVETRNRFASIAIDETGEVFSSIDPREGIRKNSNKIPNIYLDNVKNWALLYKNMRTNCAFPPVARLAGRRTVVKCQTIADFFLVKNMLAQQKVDFFTYRLASEKKRLFVIRNLPINIGLEEIKESLEEQGVQISKVTQLQTTKPTFKQLELNKGLKSVPPRALPLFLVELHDSTLSIDFLAVRYVCGLKIRIEKHRPPKGPPQCHRCQLFGHTDKACHMPPRCVKCGGNHLTADCKKEAGEAAVCANCKGGHPASYRGCPVYAKLKQRLNDLKNKAQNKTKKVENLQRPTINTEKENEPISEITRNTEQSAPVNNNSVALHILLVAQKHILGGSRLELPFILRKPCSTPKHSQSVDFISDISVTP
ncbi:hypothetical protein J437_LFUL016086 [Ladona fulva]|uniref:Gag-like protein n=1 Tax=Ladona fulva TaxID=123851 RepID=A0A8K0KJ62_LADFU|nr:hypothetical protein J437_LFUL016086 [Ladona fulva]